MIRSIFMINLASEDVLPRMERWYWRAHAPQTQRSLGPWLRRYESYRALPAPPEAEAVGYYNYRLSELWFDRLEAMPSPAGLIWLPDHARQSGLPDDAPMYGAAWAGAPGGAHPPLQLFVPALPEQDFKGAEDTFEHVAYVRWCVAHKPTQGADHAEADRWFTDVHGPEAAACEEVLRLYSSRAIAMPGDPAPAGWRYTEYWFETMSDWRRFLARDALTPPPGATGDRFPWIIPHADFIGTLCLERPDWTLADIRPLP